MKLSGAITALVTPFAGNELDLTSLRDLIKFQLAGGINGLVCCGTTGEGPVLSMKEKREVLSCAVELAKGKVPVIMGATSNYTKEAVELVKSFDEADAVLVATPYYNKPSQEGIYQHYKAIYEQTGKPLVVYDIPGRTAVSIEDDTLFRIADLPNVIAIKDSTGNLNRPITMSGIKPSFLSGDDITALPYNIHGGQGCISVTANLFPKQCSLMQEMCLKGDFQSAMSINEKLFPVSLAMFYDTNPVAVKYALSLMRKSFQPDVRLPLVLSKPDVNEKIRMVLSSYCGADLTC